MLAHGQLGESIQLLPIWSTLGIRDEEGHLDVEDLAPDSKSVLQGYGAVLPQARSGVCVVDLKELDYPLVDCLFMSKQIVRKCLLYDSHLSDESQSKKHEFDVPL